MSMEQRAEEERKLCRADESKPAKLDQFGCVRNTIKVSAGHYVDLLNPNPDSIDQDHQVPILVRGLQ